MKEHRNGVRPPKQDVYTMSFYMKTWAASIFTSATFFILGFNYIPWRLPPLQTISEKLFYTLRWQSLSLFALWLSINNVGHGRFKFRHHGCSDPINGNGERLIETQKRILQNTLEQFVCHFVSCLVLCTYLDSHSMRAIPVLVLLFVFGRLLFKVGYEIHPNKRGTGYLITYFPTTVTYLYCLYCFFVQGPGYKL